MARPPERYMAAAWPARAALAPRCWRSAASELALVVGQLVGGPGQGGLGGLELGGGLLELGLEGALAAAGVVERRGLERGDAGQQQPKQSKAEDDSAHRVERPSVGGNGWRSAMKLGGATAYLLPAATTKSAGPARPRPAPP